MVASTLDSRAAAAYADVIRQRRWDLFVTLTTTKPQGPERLEKLYRSLCYCVSYEEKGLALERPTPAAKRLRHVCAWEPQKRGAWHLHALWAAPNLPRVRRVWIARRWEQLLTIPAPIVEEVRDGVSWLVTADREPMGVRPHTKLGNADVQAVGSLEAVSSYVSKYVTKGGQLELVL